MKTVLVLALLLSPLGSWRVCNNANDPRACLGGGHHDHGNGPAIVRQPTQGQEFGGVFNKALKPKIQTENKAQDYDLNPSSRKVLGFVGPGLVGIRLGPGEVNKASKPKIQPGAEQGG